MCPVYGEGREGREGKKVSKVGGWERGRGLTAGKYPIQAVPTTDSTRKMLIMCGTNPEVAISRAES